MSDFRLTLPPRVTHSGRIFRAVNGLEQLYETKASGAGPEMLRTEMGVIYVHDLGLTLGEQLVEVDALNIDAAPGAGNTFASQTFSFVNLPISGGLAGNHRLLAASLRVPDASAANFDHADLFVQPFGDPSSAHVGIAPAADLIALGGGFMRCFFRGFEQVMGRPNQDYTFRVRSNAGGATTGRLELLVAVAPPGVQVPE